MTVDPRRTGYKEPQPALRVPIADVAENSQLHLNERVDTGARASTDSGGQPPLDIVETETVVDREASAQASKTPLMIL
eukprot:10830011-Karenia_brevis.AAC.1